MEIFTQTELCVFDTASKMWLLEIKTKFKMKLNLKFNPRYTGHISSAQMLCVDSS